MPDFYWKQQKLLQIDNSYVNIILVGRLYNMMKYFLDVLTKLTHVM